MDILGGHIRNQPDQLCLTAILLYTYTEKFGIIMPKK